MRLLKDFLQGKWLGHPLHPALVHIPVGLFTAALLFDLISLFARSDVASPNVPALLSFWCIVLGVLGALAAAPTGLADWWEIKPDKPARGLGLWHMILNLAVVGLFVVNALLRLDDFRRGAPVAGVQLLLTLLGVIVLAVSGYLGGRMVFDQGTGVVRFGKKKWRTIAQAGGANLPEEG